VHLDLQLGPKIRSACRSSVCHHHSPVLSRKVPLWSFLFISVAGLYTPSVYLLRVLGLVKFCLSLTNIIVKKYQIHII
jgi:hypothetical protein